MWVGSVGLAWSTSSTLSGTTVYGAERDRDRNDDHRRDLDARLTRVLEEAGFTGRIESIFQERLRRTLGRDIDPDLVELGRLLWFDNGLTLFRDNTCGGCHAPSHGFGDSQPMAIGVQNNGIAGPDRRGPRNQRRSPMVINTALFPALMWNGRFFAPSGDPFDNSQGFTFPPPEGTTKFPPPPNDRGIVHLLQAQAELPPTELVEVAGFHGICRQEGRDSPFCQFDVPFNELGIRALSLPEPDSQGFRNEPIRQKSLQVLNRIPEYRRLFARVFPSVRQGGRIDFDMFGKAIAEFEFTLVFADAPLDRFARGDRGAMTASEKRGALLFFGKAGCVNCHAVSGLSNEMFSDFQNHVAGVPQLVPVFGIGTSNIIYDGDGENEDFGLAQVSGQVPDRYKFRTAPLRNLKASPGFFHNGAFIRIEDAIRFHLDAPGSLPGYDPQAAGVPEDLRVRPLGPDVPTDLIHQWLQARVDLSEKEITDLVAFVRDGLHDERVTPENLCRLAPKAVPSGLPVSRFQGCEDLRKPKPPKKDRMH